MTLSVAQTRHDATLSKTLIDAKHKLGAVYFEARLIECPKNAIELKKLLKQYEKLEKEYTKDVSEVKRNQQMLSLSLTNYLKSDKASGSQEVLGQTRAEELSVPPPPGFRYRSNGEPKQLQLKSYPGTEKGHLCWQPSDELTKEKSSTIMSIIRVADLINPSRAPSDCGKLSDAARSSANPQTRPKNHKHSIEICCNSRFAFKPGTINFGKSNGKILRLGKSARSSLRPACSACQFKLKYSDEGLQKMQQYQKEPLQRWQIAPKGRYVKAPFRYNELEKMVSEVQFPARHTRSPAGQSVSNSLEALAAANKPALLSDPQQSSSVDNRRLGSSAALTSVIRRSPSDKRPAKLSPLNGLCNEDVPFEEKRSSVSFSPSTLVNAVDPGEPQGTSSHQIDPNHPSLGQHPRYMNYVPRRRQMSVHYWKPLLAEERLSCEFKVQEFLKKLPGDYTSRSKSASDELLPWARGKGCRESSTSHITRI